MDRNLTLKKKLNTYLSEKGQLRNVPAEILFEVLKCRQEWQGQAKEFYKTLGFSHRQMAGLLGKAKKLQREGHFGSENFKEIKVEEEKTPKGHMSCHHIELDNGDGKILRFPKVQHLLEYMKKVS